MFHFWGSFGVSEAMAESAASLLKKFGRNAGLSTARVIEKVALQLFGLRGDGTDDHFIQRVWSFSRKYRFNVQHRGKARQKRFHLGAGSKTLHNFFVKARAKKTIVRRS